MKAKQTAATAKKTKAKKLRWTEEQVRILKRLHKTRSNAEIAKAVGRNVASVAYKAHRLGLRKGARRWRQMGKENIQHRWGKQEG